MTRLGTYIRELRLERDWRLVDLAKKAGMPVSSLSGKERGEVAVKAGERRAIATALGMSLTEFDEGWRNQQNPTVTEVNPGRIPVINIAPAGQVIDYEEFGVDSGDGFAFVDRGDLQADLLFAVRVVGNSMAPTLAEGDTVILTPFARVAKPARQLKDGDMVFARFSEDSGRHGCTLARYYGAGDSERTVLTKDNREHQPIRCRNEEIEQLAIAVEVRRKV